jgi:hypothetical protein
MIEFTYRTPGAGEAHRFFTEDGWKGLWLGGRKVSDVEGERAVRAAAKGLIRVLPCPTTAVHGETR